MRSSFDFAAPSMPPQLPPPIRINGDDAPPTSIERFLSACIRFLRMVFTSPHLPMFWISILFTVGVVIGAIALPVWYACYEPSVAIENTSMKTICECSGAQIRAYQCGEDQSRCFNPRVYCRFHVLPLGLGGAVAANASLMEAYGVMKFPSSYESSYSKALDKIRSYREYTGECYYDTANAFLLHPTLSTKRGCQVTALTMFTVSGLCAAFVGVHVFRYLAYVIVALVGQYFVLPPVEQREHDRRVREIRTIAHTKKQRAIQTKRINELRQSVIKSEKTEAEERAAQYRRWWESGSQNIDDRCSSLNPFSSHGVQLLPILNSTPNQYDVGMNSSVSGARKISNPIADRTQLQSFPTIDLVVADILRLRENEVEAMLETGDTHNNELNANTLLVVVRSPDRFP